jgi:hypothetical protein
LSGVFFCPKESKIKRSQPSAAPIGVRKTWVGAAEGCDLLIYLARRKTTAKKTAKPEAQVLPFVFYNRSHQVSVAAAIISRLRQGQ